MIKSDYLRKTNKLLEDTTTYKLLAKDPTSKILTENNKLIDKLVNDKNIDIKESINLKLHNAVSPKLCSLPKFIILMFHSELLSVI